MKNHYKIKYSPLFYSDLEEIISYIIYKLNNPKVARDLMNKIENTTDDVVLYDSYKTIFDKYIEDVPYIGLYRNTDIVVYNQGLVGNISPNAFNLYHNIYKWYRQ